MARRDALAITRLAAYESWRSSARAVLEIRAQLQSAARADVRDLIEQLPRIAESLPLGARTAAHDLMPLLRVGAPAKDLLAPAWRVFTSLADLVAGSDVKFAADVPPTNTVKQLLDAVFEMEEVDRFRTSIDVPRLAEHADADLSVTRRVLCYWLDRGWIYMPRDHESVLHSEEFIAAEGLEELRENWHGYLRQQIANRRIQIDIPFRAELPHYWRDVTEGTALRYGIDCERVAPTIDGLLVMAVLPEDWTPGDGRVQDFTGEVQHMLASDRIQAAVHAPTTASYFATQVAAQGPNALATGNAFTQAVRDSNPGGAHHDPIVAELATLRAFFLRTAASDLDDSEAVGNAARAEKAARRGDRVEMLAALAAMGLRLASLSRQLGLSSIEALAAEIADIARS